MKPYVYTCDLLRVVDGDTIDVNVRLGFDVELKIQDYLGHGINHEGLNFGLNFVNKIFNI